MNALNSPTWSPFYRGQSHFVDPNDERRWVAVTSCITFAELRCYDPSYTEVAFSRHPDIDAARAAGEAFILQRQVSA